MKTKNDRLVNKRVKKINRQLEKDVFGNRFWLRQYKKNYTETGEHYIYELMDRLQPERNEIIGWSSAFEILTFSPLEIAMNNFIISSDFWSTYNK